MTTDRAGTRATKVNALQAQMVVPVKRRNQIPNERQKREEKWFGLERPSPGQRKTRKRDKEKRRKEEIEMKRMKEGRW